MGNVYTGPDYLSRIGEAGNARSGEHDVSDLDDAVANRKGMHTLGTGRTAAFKEGCENFAKLGNTLGESAKEVGAGKAIGMLGGALGGGSAKVCEEAAAKGGTTPLWRAVKPEELADIQAQGIFRNLGSAEGKYFSTTAEGAASYAKQAVKGFGDPPYTLIRTDVPNNLLPRALTVDRNVPAVVLPNNVLPTLKPQVLDYFPVPPP